MTAPDNPPVHAQALEGAAEGTGTREAVSEALRAELAVVIHNAACQCRGHATGLTLRSRDVDAMADAVLAAGFRRPRRLRRSSVLARMLSVEVSDVRCELDYHPPGETSGVCLAPLDANGECTRKGGYHASDGSWVPRGPWGCACPSCLTCTGNCPRCGQRDADPELGLCVPCDAALEAEVAE